MADLTHRDSEDPAAEQLAAGPEELTADVCAFDPERGDFTHLQAVRRGPDLYELLEGPGGAGFEAGDLVRVELADGELIVQERVYRQRLL